MWLFLDEKRARQKRMRDGPHIYQNQDSPRGNPFRCLLRCQTCCCALLVVVCVCDHSLGAVGASIWYSMVPIHLSSLRGPLVSSSSPPCTYPTCVLPKSLNFHTPFCQPWTPFHPWAKDFLRTRACSKFTTSPFLPSAASPVVQDNTSFPSRQTLHRAQQKEGEIALCHRHHLPLHDWVRAHPYPPGACQRWGRWTTHIATESGARGEGSWRSCKLFKGSENHACWQRCVFLDVFLIW